MANSKAEIRGSNINLAYEAHREVNVYIGMQEPIPKKSRYSLSGVLITRTCDPGTRIP